MSNNDNVGVRGPASLRLAGQKLSELPPQLSAVAAQQMPEFIQTQRTNRVNAILARYPKVSKEFVEGCLREATNNVERFKAARKATQATMDEYQTYMRSNKGESYHAIEPLIDKVAARNDLTLDEKIEAIDKLKEGVQPYNGEALWVQISQFRGDVERYDEVIEKERNTILEMKEVAGLLKRRDQEIARVLSEPIAIE